MRDAAMSGKRAGSVQRGDGSAASRKPRGVAQRSGGRRVAGPFKLTAQHTPESVVLADCLRYLTAHPGVTLAIRVNSGAVTGDDGRFVRFCEIAGQSAIRRAARRSGALAQACEHLVMAVPDIVGCMADGRFLAIECKRGGWRGPSDARERAQARFLEEVRAAGGVAGFVCGLDDVRRLIVENFA